MNLISAARLAMAFAIALTVVVAFQLPIPPTSVHEASADSVFALLFVLQLVVVLFVARGNRVVRALVYVLGGLGLMAAVLHTPQLLEDHAHPRGPTPAFLALVLVIGLAMAAAALFTALASRSRPTAGLS